MHELSGSLFPNSEGTCAAQVLSHSSGLRTFLIFFSFAGGQDVMDLEHPCSQTSQVWLPGTLT